MLQRFLRTKSLDDVLRQAERPEYRLRRALGPVQLILLGIGAIIGAGIFATIGTAAAGDPFRPGAGPALMLSFVITAVVCGFTALSYAEFASMVPISGSAYTYAYTSLGELVAWIIGWDLIIEYAVGNIAVAISWANYFKTFMAGFGIHIPDWLSIDYRTAARIVDAGGVQTVYEHAPHVFGVPIVFNLLAVAIVAAITIVLIWGIRESARFNAVMVGIKILVLSFFIVVGAFWVRPENWAPFAPNGWAGVSAGAAIVFFAYIGFDAVSTTAEEARNPQRTLPIGIIGSLVISTVLYVVVAAIFTGLISYPALRGALASEQAEPLTMALQHASSSLGWAVGIVAFGSVIAHTAVLLVFQLGQPRILFSMSRDGLLPPAFAKVHPRFRTPWISTILTGLFVALFAAFASIDEMVDLTNIGTLFAFIVVCAGVIALRVRDPDRPRPFRVPTGWVPTVITYVILAVVLLVVPAPASVKVITLLGGAVLFFVARNFIFPVLGVVSCLYLIYYLPPTSWLRFAAWLNLGLVIYVGYGTLHSGLERMETAATPGRAVADTAAMGAWLGLAGTLLLFVMRGFDLLHFALRTHPDLAGWPNLRTALATLLHAEPWLRPSAFLLVPLALNALVLCPIVARRAGRALDAEGGPAERVRGRRARGIAWALGIAILVYFVVVAGAAFGRF